MSDLVTTSYILEDVTEPLPRPAPKLATNVLDLFSLKEKVAIITGGARGIGYAVAEAYIQAGATVAIVSQSDKSFEAAHELRAKYPESQVKGYKSDVSSSDSVQLVVSQIVEEFGTVDIFVGNAGIIWTDGGIINPINEKDGVEKWQRLLDVNLSSNYYFARAIGPIFKEKNRGSFIVNASMSGHIANVPNYQTPYNTTKAALRHFASSLAVEWATFNARVNSISPGYVDSGISDVLDQRILKKWLTLIPTGRQGLTQELVGAFLYLASDASTYTTGSDMRIDGGYISV